MLFLSSPGTQPEWSDRRAKQAGRTFRCTIVAAPALLDLINAFAISLQGRIDRFGQ